MNMKLIMDRALFALSVPKCVCCNDKLNYSENAFCLKCSSDFAEYATRNCSFCGRNLNECDCSPTFLESHFVKRTIKCYRYMSFEEKTPAAALIYSLKRDNRRDVLELSTELLLTAIYNSIPSLNGYILTNIPRRSSAIIEYGIDHSALLAKNIAKKSGAEYIPFFKSNAKREQKSLDTIERRKNADFRLTFETDLTDKRVIIIDDIITSGASMANAASILRSLGCHDIIAACLAVAYKEK